MDPTPFFSIVLPVKLGGDPARIGALRRAVKSVQNQLFFEPGELELILVADGVAARRECEALMRAWAPPSGYIEVEVGNAAAARNAGVRAATGKFIAYLDSDAEWLPDYLAWIRQELQQTGADFMSAAVAVIKGNAQIGRRGYLPLSAPLLKAEQPPRGMIPDTSGLVHRSGLNAWWDEGFRRGQDWDLALSLLARPGVKYSHVPEVLARTYVDLSDRVTDHEEFSNYALMEKHAPRRCQLVGVGLPRSGTMALTAALRRAGLNAEHECGESPAKCGLLPAAIAKNEGNPSFVWKLALAEQIDRARRLEALIDNRLIELVPEIAMALPNAQFLVTLRSPLSWLRSIIHWRVLRTEETRQLATERMRRVVLGAGLQWDDIGEKSPRLVDGDEHLARYGMPSACNLLAYWSTHVMLCMDLPADRTLWMSTADLRSVRMQRILGQALSLPEDVVSKLAPVGEHNTGPDLRLFDRLDLGQLRDQAKVICGFRVNQALTRLPNGFGNDPYA